MANQPEDTSQRARKMHKVSPTMFKFENPGDEIEGTLHNVDEIIMDTGPVKRYTVVTEDGEPMSFLGAANLDASMSMVPIGSFCLVRFLEVRTSSRNRPVKAFDVFVAGE